MTWLLFPAALGVVIVIGAQIVSGRWPARRRRADSEAIARWEKTKRRGFGRLAVKKVLQVSPIAVSSLLGATLDYERVFEFPGIVFIVVFGFGVGLPFAGWEWARMRSEAEEPIQQPEPMRAKGPHGSP